MYPCDMTNAQWQVLAKHFAEMNKRGPPAQRPGHDQRYLPCTSHRLSVASATQGLPALETGLQHLCVGCAAGAAVPAGTRQGRQASWALARPSLTPNHLRPSQKGQRGYDAGKRVKGRKRYIAVDTMGLLLVVVVAFRIGGEPGLCWCGCSCALIASKPSLPMAATWAV